MTKVAFIGLGIMGSRMASKLLKNGVELIVFNRSEGPALELEKEGAKRSLSITEAVKDADVIFSMLANPEAVSELILEEGKGLSGMKKGSLWIDCSTVDPAFSRRCGKMAAGHGIEFLDAPVAGSKPQAANADLVFFVGGAEKSLKRCEEFMQFMGKKIMHIGELGMGSSFKMLVNSLLGQSMLIFSETLLLGQKMGLDKDFLLNTLPKLVVSAPFTAFKAEMIREGNYEVQFPLELMHKDLRLANLSAHEVGQPLLMAELATEIYSMAKEKGLGRLDFAAIHQYLEGKG